MPNPKKILVVEDEKSVRTPLVEKLTKNGFEVLEAKNGKLGLNTALLEKPDLILLDIVMPEMDGMTMIDHLHEDEWGKQVEIILLTNLADSNNIADAVERGVFDYLVKSDWSLDDVIAKVREKLQ